MKLNKNLQYLKLLQEILLPHAAADATSVASIFEHAWCNQHVDTIKKFASEPTSGSAGSDYKGLTNGSYNFEASWCGKAWLQTNPAM